MRARKSTYQIAREKEEWQQRQKHARILNDYSIKFIYIKGGDTSQQSARGYKDMQKVRHNHYFSTRKYHGRAYKVHTVNVTKGKVIK